MFANDGSENLSQFIGDRIISQFANNLGNLVLAVPTVANSVLFANGATTASPAAVQQFNQMTTQALGLTAFTLGNELQLLPNGTSVIPALSELAFRNHHRNHHRHNRQHVAHGSEPYRRIGGLAHHER